jgi:hypothetical protein
MQLVMTYTEGDGCTYSCDVALPVIYKSAEAAIVDFEIACKAAHEWYMASWRNGTQFKFASKDFQITSFFFEGKFVSPDFMTVDEWFERY